MDKRIPENAHYLYNEFSKHHYSNPREAFKVCERMVEEFPDNDYTVGYAYYYMAEISTLFSENIDAERYAKIALEHCEKCENHSHILACLSLLGTLACNRSDEPMAAEYLYSALEKSESMTGSALAGKYIIYFYLGSMNNELENWSTAKKYLNLSMAEFNSYFGEGNYPGSYVSLIYSKAIADIGLKNAVGLREDIDEMSKLDFTNVMPVYPYLLKYVEGYAYYLEGDKEKAVEIICKYLDEYSEKLDSIDVYSSMAIIFDVVFEAGLTQYMEKAIKILSDAITDANESHFALRSELGELKIKYYSMLGDEHQLLDAYKEFFEVQKAYLGNNIAQRRANLELRDKMYREMSQKRSELQASIENSRTDALTKVQNRMGLEFYTQDIVKRCYDSKTPIGALILDIDKYKQFNDTYGHIGGDECLKKLGAIFSEASKGHFCCRYGGDEFLFVFEGLTADEIHEIAERIRKGVKELAITHEASPTGIVTVSQGIYAAVPTDERGDFKDYIYMADLALYNCKKNGRDRICRSE